MMKGKATSATSVALLLSLLLSGCRTVPVDEKTSTRVLVGPIVITNSVPMAELVRRVIVSSRQAPSAPPIDYEFVLRDRRVGEAPEVARLPEKDIPTFADWGESTFVCRAMPLDQALRVLLNGSDLDFHVSPWTRAGRLLVTVGPPELVRDHPEIRRRTYQIPETQAATFTNLPPLLSATSISMAYDQEQHLLTVIDNEHESSSDSILLLLGAKRLYNGMNVPEL